MRVGINLLALVPSLNGGVEVYARNLLQGLKEDHSDNEYYLFTNRASEDRFEIRDPRFHTISVGVRGDRRPPRVLWEQAYLPFAARKIKLDVLHSPSYTWPVLSDVPGVVTIHDMLYAAYPMYVAQPKLAFWRILVPWSAGKCRRIITVSENSKRDILRYLRVPTEKVVVTPEALDRRFQNVMADSHRIRSLKAKYGLERPYILNVGGCAAHKNAAVLIRALARVRSMAETEHLSLVIAGRDNGAREYLRSLAESLGLRSAVIFTGYVSEEDLPDLYCGATLYASPSYFEGFGLTILEAMASGTPVMVSDRGSLPEVVGEAALVVDPDRQEDIVAGLRRLACDSELRDELVQKARKRLACYSWRQATRLTLKAYQETADGAQYSVEARRQAWL